MSGHDPDPIVAAFAELGTAEVSDALDKLRLPGSALGIHRIIDGRSLCGRAFTLRYAPVMPQPGNVGDFIDDVPIGSVVAIDNAGRTDCTVWGGILTDVAARRGVAGTVIDGVCRDVDVSRHHQYPLYARGNFMRTGKDRVQLVEKGGTIALAGVSVRPGDIILGNSDGIVVVPQEREDEVLEAARHLNAVEEQILTATQKGARLDYTRKRLGYYQLQSADAGDDK